MDQRIKTLLDAMTLEEQVSLLSGADFWSVRGIERLGIGDLVVTEAIGGGLAWGSVVLRW